MSRFFLQGQKVKTKIKISRDKSFNKRLLRWKSKAFFIIFKGFSLKQIKQFFWKGRILKLLAGFKGMECINNISFCIQPRPQDIFWRLLFPYGDEIRFCSHVYLILITPAPIMRHDMNKKFLKNFKKNGISKEVVEYFCSTKIVYIGFFILFHFRQQMMFKNHENFSLT